MAEHVYHRDVFGNIITPARSALRMEEAMQGCQEEEAIKEWFEEERRRQEAQENMNPQERSKYDHDPRTEQEKLTVSRTAAVAKAAMAVDAARERQFQVTSDELLPPMGPLMQQMNDDQPVLPGLPRGASARKATPICRGVLDYFPLALAEIARVSKAGNDQHNPGEPLHWARGKSTDHADCLIRHILDRGKFDVDGQRHTAKMAWRALALLQEELEKAR
jgi:Domain of unknown function (DUF5664)